MTHSILEILQKLSPAFPEHVYTRDAEWYWKGKRICNPQTFDYEIVYDENDLRLTIVCVRGNVGHEIKGIAILN